MATVWMHVTAPGRNERGPRWEEVDYPSTSLSLSLSSSLLFSLCLKLISSNEKHEFRFRIEAQIQFICFSKIIEISNSKELNIYIIIIEI